MLNCMTSLSMSRSVVAVFITPVFLTHWVAAVIKSQHIKREVKGRTNQAILLFIKEQKRRAQRSRDITEATILDLLCNKKTNLKG